MTALQVLSALSLLAFTVPVAFAFKFWRERNNAHYMFDNLQYNYQELTMANMRLTTNNDYLHGLLKRHNITPDPWEMYNILPDDLEQWDWA
jgi:hypothetical protein